MPPLCLVWFVAVILTTCQCLLHPAGPPNALPTVGGTTISECSWNISSGFPSWTPGEGGTQAMTKIPWMSARPSEVPKMTGQNLSLSLYIYIYILLWRCIFPIENGGICQWNVRFHGGFFTFFLNPWVTARVFPAIFTIPQIEQWSIDQNLNRPRAWLLQNIGDEIHLYTGFS